MRRWIGEQTNSFGVLTESLILSDKPNFGTWTLEVNAFVSKIIVIIVQPTGLHFDHCMSPSVAISN